MMILSSPSRCDSVTSATSEESATVTAVGRSGASPITISLSTSPASSDCHLNPAQLQALACDMVVMINDERSRRNIEPLHVCQSLETFARMEADAIAETGDVKPWFQSEEELEQLLKSPKAGENIGAGDSVEELHANVMAHQDQCQRLLSYQFKEVGVAIVQGYAGKLYMCQLFRNQEAEEQREVLNA